LRKKNVQGVGIEMLALIRAKLILGFVQDVRKILPQLEKLDPLFKNKYFLYILICIVLDLLSKHLALNYLNHSTPIEFIPFIDFYLTFNSGVAFGFLDIGSRVLSNMLTFAGILIVVYMLALLKNENDSTKKLALSIIIGGALGNIFDRLPDGYVTDFLHLKINNFSFFIFNIADASITIGAVLLIYLELFKKDNA
jgi:signal peptidase II